MSARVIKTEDAGNFSPAYQPEAKQNNRFFPGGTGEVRAFVFPKVSQNGVIQEHHYAQEFEARPFHAQSIVENTSRAAIEHAQTEAEKIIEVAKMRAQEIEREAFARGEAAGRASVSMEIDNQVSDLRQQLSRTLSELQGLKSEIESKVEREMVELAIEISKKIVQREVTVDREVALTLARVALARLHSRSTTIIRLHPDDYAYAMAHRERLESDGALEIVEDRSVGLGGCVIQTEMGEIDARIVQQFREVEKGFWGESPY